MKKYSLQFPILLILILWFAGPAFAWIVSEKATGRQNILVIMAKFPDVNPSLSIERLREKYFGKLNRYLKAVSHGKTWIEGKMTDWYTLPHEVGHYRLSSHNLAVDKQRVHRLIQDAINLADQDEDFAQYSMLFVSLGAKRQDYGMMGLCGYPGMLGWQSQIPVRTTAKGQRIPGGVAIYCENAHVGVVFHDMAHIMGGVKGSRRVLPCLYDHDLQAQKGSFRNQYQFYLVNVGFFDPMSCHFYKPNQGPPGVCAWTKLRLNWIASEKIVEIVHEKKKLLIGPLSKGESKVQAVRLPIDATTYYLVENRQHLGPDRNLPSDGILIYYCDDEIAECRHGKSPIKLVDADPSVPELKGAPFTLTGRSTYRDEKRRVSVRLLARKGEYYEIYVSNGR